MKKYVVTLQSPGKISTWILQNIDPVENCDVKETGTVLKRNGVITAVVPKDWLIVIRDEQ